MDLPKWINKNLLQSSLRKYFNDDGTNILEFSSKPAISAGENYTTYVFRINITYARSNSSRPGNKENLSLIFKCMREGMMEGLVTEMDMFQKEVDMFLKVLPKLNGICGYNALSGACVNASLQPIPYLIVQDICPLGFKVHERQCGLDLDHTLKVLEKMAMFHASSYIVCEKDPSVLSEMYSKGIFRKIPAITAWITLGFEMILKLTTDCKEFNMYHDKIKKVVESDFMQSCLDSWQRTKGEFSVLNHGDSWVNNMMFSYDDKGKVKDCKYLDFQLSVYGSPAIDLHYFISTSLANDVIQEVDHLLDFYYVNLLMALNRFKCSLKSVPSLKQFKEDFRKRSIYGLITMATVLGLVRSDSRNDANFDELMSSNAEDGFRSHCYTNDNYKAALIRLLPIYDKMGVFS